MSNFFETPDTLPDQRAWAQKVDLGEKDIQFHIWRKLASRRILLEAAYKAFDQIPDLEIITFEFKWAKKSVKDSVIGESGVQNAIDKKVTESLSKALTGARKRIGASTQAWEGLQAFFGEGRQMRRDTRDVAIEILFDENTKGWTDLVDAQIKAAYLNQGTPNASSSRSGPRL